MDSLSTQSGVRVIDLTSLSRTAGLVSGLVTGFLVTWLVTGEIGRAVVLGVAGAVGGAIAGRIVGRFRYTTGGHRVAVKRGPSSVQATITVALSASLPSAILAWLGCLTILGGPAPSLATGAASLLAGVLTGVFLGRAASRL
jgi:hypothetical protein